MPDSIDSCLAPVVERLQADLGDNLYSCCLYGSAVRGNLGETSDLNLLIILEVSAPASHIALAGILGEYPRIDPFILSQQGFDRSLRAFSPKFASIRRNYRVLAGADPLATMKIDPQEERFLVEQVLRNLRLRMVYFFVTGQETERYRHFLVANITAIFVHFSEVARLNGSNIPKEIPARIPVFVSLFGIDGNVLNDLLELKEGRDDFSAGAAAWHSRVFPLVDTVVLWIEEHWPAPRLNAGET